MGKISDSLALQQGRFRSDTGKHFNGKDNEAWTDIMTKSSRISECDYELPKHFSGVV